MGGGDSAVGGSLRVSSGFGGALVRAGGPAWVGGPGWAAGHPFAASGAGMMGCAVHWPVGSIRTDDHATMGVMTCTTRTDQGKAGEGVHATLGGCSRART